MNPPARIHMVRHGQVDQHWIDRIYGALDVPLSEHGREQSREMAGRFVGSPLASVVSSGLERAEFAAALLRVDRDLERRDDARLCERSRGDWAGLGRDEINARQPGGWEELQRSEGLLTTPGGETLEAVAARVIPALEELARANAGASLVVVAHLWVMRVALCQTLGLPLERCARLAIGHCHVVSIDWPSNGSTSELPCLVGFGPGPEAEDRSAIHH